MEWQMKWNWNMKMKQYFERREARSGNKKSSKQWPNDEANESLRYISIINEENGGVQRLWHQAFKPAWLQVADSSWNMNGYLAEENMKTLDFKLKAYRKARKWKRINEWKRNHQWKYLNENGIRHDQ